MHYICNVTWMSRSRDMNISNYMWLLVMYIISRDWGRCCMDLLSHFTMHEGECQQEVQSRGRLAEGLDVFSAQVRVRCDNKTSQIDLKPDYNMAFLISLLEC